MDLPVIETPVFPRWVWIQAFHLDFEKYLIDLEQGIATRGFLDSRYESVKEFYLDLALLGMEFETFILSSWITVRNPDNWVARSVRFLAGTGTIIKGIQTVNKYWTQKKHSA